MTAEPDAKEEGRGRFRMRLLAACVLLTGLAMIQSPGLLVPDTKLDLVIDPLDFLQRASHLWDPVAAFGQLQNQAYGYLWPMGPFFLIGSVLDIPGWVIQRLWLALVMSVALVGSAKVSRALGVRSDLACILAGVAYALSPRMLTTLGPISIEAWPSALAPWVLLPLVVGSTRGSPRRAAALSALAIAMVGGVNAAATSAVLPLGALWLLTRTPGPRRRSLMLWWPMFTLLATLWWLVPLFVMGAYSPPFLDYIESAANTTFPTTLFDALRGTSNWVPYVDQSSRAGNDLIRIPYLALNSGVVLIAGFAGLMARRNPHRLFLITGVVTGLLLVTAGHTGSLEGWFAPQLQAMLDGTLAPLRNVHKFDAVIRLPMVVGLAWAVEELVIRARASDTVSERLNLRVLTGLVIFGIAATSLPAVTGRIAPADGFAGVPDYWADAAGWLEAEQNEGVALLIPGSAFGTYLWGRPQDEPMQSLARKAWAVRNAVPLAPAGNVRMLDAIEQRLVQGAGSSGLATYLRRAGISHLVVRNDLERSPDIVDPVLVHQAIDQSPGLERVASFGPAVGGEANLENDVGERFVVNGGWQNEVPAIEVYAVSGDVRFATAVDRPPLVVGGPEDLLDLNDLEVLGDEPAVLAADVGHGGRVDLDARLILTDGVRAVERNFGRIHDGVSATRVRGDRPRLRRRVADYSLPGGDKWATWAAYEGAVDVTASSSQSDPTAYGPVERGQFPYAALDDDPDTEWVSGPFTEEGHWWRVDYGAEMTPGRVTITGSGPSRQLVRVRTDSESSEEISLVPGVPRSVVLEKPTTWLRVEDLSGRADARMRLSGVDVEGADVRRKLTLPDYPEDWGTPDAVVLRAISDARTGCADVESAVRCAPDRDIAPEESKRFDRVFSVPSAGAYEMNLVVRPKAGPELDELVLRGQFAGATSSSVGNPDTRASAIAAIDGELGTAWTATLSDERPELRLNWLGRRKVDGLALRVAKSTAARRPTMIEMRWPGGSRTLSIGDDGSVDFPAIRTSWINLTMIDAEPVTDLAFDGVSSSPVPIGISEIEVRGVPSLPLTLPTTPARSRCGTGPDVVLNGEVVKTRIDRSPFDLQGGAEFPATLCVTEPTSLQRGRNSVSVVGSEAFVGVSLVLSKQGVIRPTIAIEVPSDRRSPVERRVLPEAGGSVATRENVNPGWTGQQGSQPVSPEITDGWRQGWASSSAEPIRWSFAPDGAYRLGLISGLVALLTLLGLTLVPARRWQDSAEETLTERGVSAVVVLSATLLAGGLLAGWVGLLVSAVGGMLGLVLSHRAPEGAWVSGLLLLPAALAYVFQPWGGPEGWAGSHAWVGQMVLLALSAACASLIAVEGRIRLLTRRNGSSTQR